MDRHSINRLSAKAGTPLPTAVRDHLGLGPDDPVEYELRDGVVLLRPKPTDGAGVEDPFALFDEWSSAEDEAGYADL